MKKKILLIFVYIYIYINFLKVFQILIKYKLYIYGIIDSITI